LPVNKKIPYINLFSRANLTSAAVFETLSFARRFFLYVSAVTTEMKSVSAICWFVCPSAISRRTACSLVVIRFLVN